MHDRHPLRIGVSANFFHPDANRSLFKGKTLLYLEQSKGQWIMARGALPVLLPPASAPLAVRDLLAQVDGLVLHGGADVSPQSYGEPPRRPEWEGDRIRDRYELALIEECLARDKPLLGICRGLQMLNVACGGTLYQDLGAQLPGARVHRDQQLYDRLFHPVELVAGSTMARLFGAGRGRVNSVHHQAVREVGRDLRIAARCPGDGVIEALELDGAAYALAVQWHPEFQDPADGSLLDPFVLLDDFLERCAEHRG